MIRRHFLTRLTGLLGLTALPAAARPTRYHLIQACPLAGFQHHQAHTLTQYLTVGDRLELRREPQNPHDPNAIRVDWNGRKLGYIPAHQNQTTALMLDHGIPLQARIGNLSRHSNPWRRLSVEVWLVG